MSVRSGAAFSMPGMMETVLNIGLNDASVKGLAEEAGDERFAWDSYRRLVQMFGKTVLEMPGEVFSDALEKAKSTKGVASDVDLDVDDLKLVVTTFKDAVREHSGQEFPQHPREQLDMAINAVFDSWNTERARLYRRRERIPQHLGTAVNVCTRCSATWASPAAPASRSPGTRHPGGPARTATTCPMRRARMSLPGSRDDWAVAPRDCQVGGFGRPSAHGLRASNVDALPTHLPEVPSAHCDVAGADAGPDRRRPCRPTRVAARS